MSQASTKQIEEALGILQEECAEVIVEVSKIRRFGMDSTYNDGPTQRERLEKEVGDVLAMVDILLDQGVLSKIGLAISIEDKKNKLKEWSTIYETESK
jgi:NTP pyrophosphatase (non-canonical NTP hydrolase)